MNKKDLKFYIDGGRITIQIKIPDHQPPHIHAFMNANEEDVIFIKGERQRDNEPGYLPYKKLELCREWILENRTMLLKKWEELEDMGHIPKPSLMKKDKKTPSLR